MQIYQKVLDTYGPGGFKSGFGTEVIQTQESWVKKIIIYGLETANVPWQDFVTVKFKLTSGREVPALGSSNKGIAVSPWFQVALDVDERNPYPHEIRIDWKNTAPDPPNANMKIQIIVITEEKPMKVIQEAEDNHLEIT